MLDEVTLAWFAGILDARGHIDWGDRRGTQMPRIAVTTRRRDLLDRLCELTGVGLTDSDRTYTRRPCADHCAEHHQHIAVRQSSKWRTDSGRATIILAAVRPWIVVQVPEVAEALRLGLASYPPARGDTCKQMAALGWPIPLVRGGRVHGLDHGPLSEPD